MPFTLALDGARRPQVWLTGFGDSSLEFELVVWLTEDATVRPGAVAAGYNWALHSALQRHEIEIPFPQRDLNVRQLFGLDGEDARAALGLTEVKREPSPGETARDASDGPADNDAANDVTGLPESCPAPTRTWPASRPNRSARPRRTARFEVYALCQTPSSWPAGSVK